MLFDAVMWALWDILGWTLMTGGVIATLIIGCAAGFHGIQRMNNWIDKEE